MSTDLPRVSSNSPRAGLPARRFTDTRDLKEKQAFAHYLSAFPA